MRNDAEHPLVGLDLNATRARAVGGAAEGPKQVLSLEGDHAELPLAISLEGRRPDVGRAGTRLCRRLPHYACVGFLPRLGEPSAWIAGRHRLDAASALRLVYGRLAPGFSRARGLGLVLPAYLKPEQVAEAAALAEQAGLPVFGTVPTPLAAALVGHAEQSWAGPALVVDIDDYALSLAVVPVDAGEIQLFGTQILPRLSMRAWKERLLNGVADRCIRQSRRDPRDSAAVEQSLYEQLELALEAFQHGRMAELTIQAGTWYQNVLLQAADAATLCASLTRPLLQAMQALLATTTAGPPRAVVLTAAAGRLPGLVAALEESLAAARGGANEDHSADFGDALMEESDGQEGRVQVLAAEAPARAAHVLAVRWHRGEMPRGPVVSAALFPPQPQDIGPPRLHFRGQDYLLRDGVFTLGGHLSCNLAFDSALYPTVAPRHCDIVLERWSYILRDRSHQGTFVNQRPVVHEISLHPGDWIRLGTGGPLLRFLGQAMNYQQLMTTA
jgi:hypothetical protein